MQYKKQWKVPSASDANKEYTVSLKDDGEYVCHCFPFLKSRQPCKHILAVRRGEYPEIGETVRPEPELSYAMVEQVKPDPENKEKLLVPLVPFGPGHADFVVTVYYDQLCYGVHWKTIKAAYRIDSFGPQDVKDYIRQRGFRTILDPDSWVDGLGYTAYKRVPLTENQRLGARP